MHSLHSPQSPHPCAIAGSFAATFLPGAFHLTGAFLAFGLASKSPPWPVWSIGDSSEYTWTDETERNGARERRSQQGRNQSNA